MRAGKLDRLIRVERPDGYTDDGHGGQDPVWAKVADIRAQIVQASTEEFIRSYGASDETVIIFRTRFIDGVTPEDRITYGGGEYDIKEVKELGRRQGLEVRCVRRPE
ncbi:phage head closure protein [Ochrobactrum sp. S1502_03]|uniref:phage head closure protein n=1 Tax=Ochrobactrum sp. S1502_03 TaxID=3108451 RepID=UPI0037CB3E42